MHKIDGPGNVNGQFVSENVSTGQPGAEVTPEWLNAVQGELAAVVQGAGILLNKLDNTQLAQAIQSGALNAAYASGTADAITAAFTPAITAWKEMPFFVRATAANATAVPTFTPNSGTVTPLGMVKANGLPLVPGDIPGAGYWMHLRYDATLGKVVLMNPATGLRAQIQTITATVASNALTLGLAPTSLDFRSATQSSGAVNTRSFSSALSLIVPAGATLGTTSGQSARLTLLALDNAGTVELAVVNLSGGTSLDESTLASTTAISTTSALAGTIYSTTARSNLPFRVVGYFDIVEATAGTWASFPTLVSGAPAPLNSPAKGASLIAASGTFVVPASSLRYVVVGGGGGGGGVAGSSAARGGGGGGAGGAAYGYLTGLTIGSTITVTIGAAGAAGNSSGGNGSNGGTSSISSGTQTISTISATGGSGGSGATNNLLMNQGGGGVGSGGAVNLAGGPGVPSSCAIASGSVPGVIGAGGGASYFGQGGTGAAGMGSGVASTNYGSGGSGGVCSYNASGYSGQPGASGAVLFEW